MRNFDELDEIIGEYEKGKMDRRTFISKAVLMGLTLSSINAFLFSGGTPVREASAQTPPPGKPADITVGFFPSWVGGWSGAVIRNRELWKKYLPAGSKVDWDIHVVGAPVANNLMAGKLQIGYLGDTPGMIATTKRDIADLRIVEFNMFSNTGQICACLLVRNDAPPFKTLDEALQWLVGKKIGVSGKGSCGDRFVSGLLKRHNIKAEVQYLDPTIVKTALQSKKIDAAQSFQPHVAQIMNEGLGRLAFTGARWNWQEGNVILMRKDFIDAYPDAAKGWIKADIEALQFMLQYPYETVKIVAKDLPGYSTKDLWMSLYGQYPKSVDSMETNAIAQVGFDEPVMRYISEAFQFLHSIGVIKIDKPLPGAVYPDLVNAAIREMGIKIPLGTFKGLPPAAFKG
ncbi:MAG: ABC transporter substrate-binding protein [Thermodesulfovibrionales bacterium]